MLITIPGDVDLRVRPGVTAADVLAAAGLSRAWCGPTELDPEHPAGMAPLVTAARITSGAAPSCLPVRVPHLTVLEGPDAGGTVPLASTVHVGRDPACDLTVSDPAVSAQHAIVTTGDVRRGADVRVRDLRSANGTVAANGRRLRGGDTFMVGRTLIALAGVEPADDDSPGVATPMRWGGLVAGAASGLALAAMTGRWALALVGIVPAAIPWLTQMRRRRPAPSEPWQPPPGPLAVRGDTSEVAAYVRAVLVARGRGPLNDRWREPWTRWLAPPTSGDDIVEVAPGAPWPSWCERRVDITADGRVEHDGHHPHTLGPLAMSAATADLAARRLAASAPDDELPISVRWADLYADVPDISELDSQPPSPHLTGAARSLTVRIGATADGPFTLDLDADGPHVLVAGTTGAGKSVALETLVSALAHAHSPRDLNLALIDFKGGAGLRGCMALPHVSATLTDLDGALASRAIAGLAHELATRKANLEAHGLSSLSDWERRGGAPARLVVVIDEYQEIAARHSSFLPDLARIAAQGRSLGLHLILATQRPAGAVTPEVRANVSTTIALRVASDSESHDLLGTAAAARLSASTPGRAIIASGGAFTEVQIAAPDADPSPGIVRVGQVPPPGRPLALVAAARWDGHQAAAPLWREPLPAQWEADADGPDEAGIAVGLVDRPAERMQHVAYWDPATGPAVIIGPPRSGRTGALRALATQARRAGLTPVWLSTDPRLASRTLHVAASKPQVMIMVDDLEATLAVLATVDDGAAVDDLMRRPALRLPTAMAGGPGASSRLASGAAVVAVLSGLEPSTAQQWGVPRAALTDGAPAGPGSGMVRCAGRWDGVQLAWSATHTGHDLVAPLPDPARTDAPNADDAGAGAAGAAGEPWGWGGDDAATIDPPTGLVAIVGPPGPARDLAAQAFPDDNVTCVELPALVPAGTDAIIVTEPTPRTVRGVTPHGWRGLTDPAPTPSRVVLVRDGRACAVQLAARDE